MSLMMSENVWNSQLQGRVGTGQERGEAKMAWLARAPLFLWHLGNEESIEGSGHLPLQLRNQEHPSGPSHPFLSRITPSPLKLTF